MNTGTYDSGDITPVRSKENNFGVWPNEVHLGSLTVETILCEVHNVTADNNAESALTENSLGCTVVNLATLHLLGTLTSSLGENPGDKNSL